MSFDVEGGGRELTATNGLIGSPIDGCGWAGRWAGTTSVAITDGVFTTEAYGALGPSDRYRIQTRGIFTSPTQAELTMTVLCTRYLPGVPSPIPYPASETHTFTAHLVDPSGGGQPPGGALPQLPEEPKPAPGTGYPSAPAPAPAGTRGCETLVKAGELEAVATCWRRRGDVYVSAGRARINGIDLTPARDGIDIRLHRRTRRISSTGPVEVRVGALRLLRATIDWRSRTVVFSIRGSSARRDPGPRFDLESQTFFGLPVDGSVELAFAGGQTQLKASVKVPDNPALRFLARFAGWSGDLVGAATNSAGLVLDSIKITFPGLQAGFVDVANASFSVARAGDRAYHFDGGATLYPFRMATIGLSGDVGFGVGDGYFKLGAAVEQLNRPLVYGFFLQRVAFGFQLDPFGLRGSAGVTFGPQFRLGDDLVSTARLDGGLTYLAGRDGRPGALELAGNLEVAEAQLADGKVTLAGGKVDASGNASLTVGKYGIEGSVDGWFDGLRAFNLEGAATLSLPGPDQGGEAVLSSRGVGACRTAAPRVGFGYRWGQGLDGLDVFGWSCDLGGWREVRGADAASAARAATAIRVRRGERTLALSAVGDGGAPRVAFLAPDGARFEPSMAEDGAVITDRALLFQDHQTATTYFAVDRPRPGTWRVEPLAGSVPVARLRAARALPQLRIRARVAGHGRKRTLRVGIRNRAGAAVTFVEQGTGVRRTLAQVRRSHARLRFSPATGPGGRRQILAVVERRGHPVDGARRVATFLTARVRPPAPRRVRLRRAGTHHVLTWRGRRRLRYSAIVRTSDGRKLRYVRDGARGRVVIDHVPRKVSVRATVTAVAPSGQISAPRRVPGPVRAEPPRRDPRGCPATEALALATALCRSLG